MIAGMLNPKMLVFARARVIARFASMITGDTAPAIAASKAAATAPAWQAAPSEWEAAVASHAAYGAAASVIFVAAAPCHAPHARFEVTDANDAAAELNSPANSPQAVAAASIGPDPAPVANSAELISGGNMAYDIVDPSVGGTQLSCLHCT
ncbi:hypothetical protein LAUMK35_04264 [Mycobacterium pseudokansasii]|uniref:Uncharacterized protein n=1 Tax=Mycobacterium pseudokansasii TaxID=2341080 RepID=A0A498QVZ1_9MYCO|nr:hypothetical protein A4G27_06425 [Mycobacterium kansasii]VAZ99265.1 hypothetical protein LAUMK35_04264 [Mycobacterium pseudokansasii]VBA30418.1 hypothetical protein LAUMK21_04259 [Mycobacterium pseudokansasii]VBA53587.1 hypothetical protein LAUMK142_04155 [Mycobacterium pseudokansasii]